MGIERLWRRRFAVNAPFLRNEFLDGEVFQAYVYPGASIS
jgi:hypothetical protein